MPKPAQTRESVLSTTAIRENGCVEWTGSLAHDGYGSVHFEGKQKRAHRVVYELLAEPIPDGLVIDHLCRNKKCVSPDHLEPVTSRVNTLRGISFSAKNASKTHCKNGHEFDATNTYQVPARSDLRNGGRNCRKCILEASKRYQARKRKERSE